MPHFPKIEGDTGDQADELDHLRQRNEYLESTVRWHRFAFDLLQDTTELIGNDDDRLNKTSILSAAYEQLVRILDWEAVGFLLIEEHDQNFHLQFCRPSEHTDFLQVEVDKLIESGQFAWALNQNHEMVLQSFGWDCNLILHVLATRARIRGMFIGVPTMNYEELPDSSLQLISLILNQVVYSLESATLYELLSSKTDDLQLLVRQRTKQLEFQHQHDTLTGRPNRQYLIQHLDEFVQRSNDKGRSLVIFRCNIAGFKRINEIYGFAGGDSIIKSFSDRLLASAEQISHGARFASEVLVSRLTGDQFCIVFVSVKDEERVKKTARSIIAAVEKPYTVEGEEVSLGIYLGSSTYPTDGVRADQVFSHAETALYSAKARGVNEFVQYNKSLSKVVSKELRLANSLRIALQKGDFYLEFEPQIDMFDQTVVAAQTMLKWKPPDDSTIEHEELVLLVDQVGIGVPFTEYILTNCARSLRKLADEGFTQVAAMVDLSSSFFRQENLADRLMTIYLEFQLPVQSIEISIPEGVISEDVDRSERALKELHEKGIKVWIRNVGTGSLSLPYLKRLPIFGMKIDPKLSMDIVNNRDDSAIIHALTQLGHHFGVTICIPGIETEQQLEALEKTECDRAQGFFFGQPLPVDKFANFLRGRSRNK